jgi:hypothetical protein
VSENIDLQDQETTRPERPQIKVGVVMRREPVVGPMSRWQTWRWVLADVVPHDALPTALLADHPDALDSAQPVPIEPVAAPIPAGASDTAAAPSSHWLFPNHPVTLFRDDTEGYYLNLVSPQPCFWVLWRLPEGLDDAALPEPLIVTLSYHDAGRWLDAQEKVDQVPAPPEVVQWLADFVNAHYQPEPKKRKRPVSFQPLTDRFGNPARISTEKGPGPQNGGGHGR